MSRAGHACLIALVLLAGCGRKTNAGGYATDTRTAIRIVGSARVFPFSAAAAEHFARAHPDFRAPVVESTGTVRGVGLFCGGVGLRFPDIVGVDRRMRPAEARDCLAHGVTAVAELAIGSTADRQPLFLYVKRQHLGLIDGLRPLLADYVAGCAPGGPLARRGLVPAPAAIRARSAAAAAALPAIDLAAAASSSS